MKAHNQQVRWTHRVGLLLAFVLLVAGHSKCYTEDDAPRHVDDTSVIPADAGERLDDFIFNSQLLTESMGEGAQKLRDHGEEEEVAGAGGDTPIRNHPFEKTCPHGYFRCSDGECISMRWHCDGHYDCDDFSDEFNCTKIDLPIILNNQEHSVSPPAPSSPPTDRPPKITNGHGASPLTPPAKNDLSSINFNSTIEPLMIFSTGTSVRGLWMKSRIYFDIVNLGISAITTPAPSITQAFSIFFDIFNADRQLGEGVGGKAAEEVTVKSRSTIVGIDMNPHNKEVFWVELGKDPGVYSAIIEDERFESRHRRQFHGHKKLVEFGLLSPEDVAIDTIGKNVYITDAGLPAVVVCSLTSYCKIIVSDRIHKPRAIIADSSSGWITYTDWGDHPGIFLVSMDGKRRETLIETDVVWPNGLAADYASNYLYWADARLNKIERVDLKTKKRYELLKEVSSNPFSVSVFENRIYWSDWSKNDIRSCDKVSGNNSRVVMHADDIYGIHIYHPSIYTGKEQEDPCWSKHCSHLCLVSPTSPKFDNRNVGPVGATCACPDSMALSMGDRSTCYEARLSFLLLNVHNYVAQVFPERIGLHVVDEVIYSKDHAIQDIASDWINFRIFFYDASRSQIYLADMSGDSIKLKKFVTVGRGGVRGLLYDSRSDNLYWLDPEEGTLTLCSVKTKYKKVIRRNLDRPTAMVLDSRNRVFYIASLGTRPHIMRTDINALDRNDLLISDKEIGLPVALYLDEQRQRLYWADAKRETIESVDVDVKSQLNGTRAGTRIRHRSRLGTILGFTVYHDSLLWTIQDGGYLYKARVAEKSTHFTERPVAFKLPQNPNQDHPSSDNKRIITVDPRFETISSPCQKRACLHACVVNAHLEAQCVDEIEPTSAMPPIAGAIVAGVAQNHYVQSSTPMSIRDVVAKHFDTLANENHNLPEAAASHHQRDPAEEGNRMVWLIVLLLLLSVTGLIVVLSVLILYKQGKLPRQVSQLSVSFISPASHSNNDKDKAMLLLDTDS